MEPEEYATMRELEDDHWWFTSRRDLALSLARSSGTRVLDLGCGTGGLLSRLPAGATGVDASSHALTRAHGRGLPRLTLSDATALPFRDEAFDLVFALDVFEHVLEDAAAAREVHRVLARGGRLIASVPAHPRLWSEHDVALHHHRRYRKEGFDALLRSAGFQVERLTWCMTALFPAVAAARAARRLAGGGARSARSEARRHGPLLNGLLRGVLALENVWLRRLDAPFGLSLIASATKAPAPGRGPVAAAP